MKQRQLVNDLLQKHTAKAKKKTVYKKTVRQIESITDQMTNQVHLTKRNEGNRIQNTTRSTEQKIDDQKVAKNALQMNIKNHIASLLSRSEERGGSELYIYIYII